MKTIARDPFSLAGYSLSVYCVAARQALAGCLAAWLSTLFFGPNAAEKYNNRKMNKVDRLKRAAVICALGARCT